MTNSVSNYIVSTRFEKKKSGQRRPMIPLHDVIVACRFGILSFKDHATSFEPLERPPRRHPQPERISNLSVRRGPASRLQSSRRTHLICGTTVTTLTLTKLTPTTILFSSYLILLPSYLHDT